MEIAYERTTGKSHMVVSDESICPDYQIEMCKRNRIVPFLSFETIVADGQLEFWYDITGMQSLEEYVKHERFGAGQLRAVLEAVCKSVEAAADYLLSEKNIRLLPKLIYLPHDGGEVRLCFKPETSEDETSDFHALMEYLLPVLDHEDEQAVSLAYQVYQITSESNYGIDMVRTLLEERQVKKENKEKEAEESYNQVAEERIEKHDEAVWIKE